VAGLLQCVVTCRADEPIHLSRDREIERGREGRRERDRQTEREKERQRERKKESERGRDGEDIERESERKRANVALPTRFLCGPQLCCFLGPRNETLPANNPTQVLILRRRVYVPAP